MDHYINYVERLMEEAPPLPNATQLFSESSLENYGNTSCFPANPHKHTNGSRKQGLQYLESYIEKENIRPERLVHKDKTDCAIKGNTIQRQPQERAIDKISPKGPTHDNNRTMQLPEHRRSEQSKLKSLPKQIQSQPQKIEYKIQKQTSSTITGIKEGQCQKDANDLLETEQIRIPKKKTLAKDSSGSFEHTKSDCRHFALRQVQSHQSSISDIETKMNEVCNI